MRKIRITKSFVVAVPLMIVMSAPGLTRAQSPAAQMVQPSAPSGTQADPYAAAFAGLTYSDAQKEAIRKIRQDISDRKAVVQKDSRLTDDQKDAMLTGYTRIEYNLIYKELTPEQKKHVSTRMHASRATDQAQRNAGEKHDGSSQVRPD